MKLSPAAAIIAFSAQSPSSPAVVMAGSGKTGKIVPSSSNGKLSKVFKSKSKALVKTSAANSYSYSSSMSIDIDTDPPTSRPTVLDRCGLTQEERAEQTKQLMSTVSDPSTFDDPNSPQSKALNWITNEDAISPILCPNQIEEGVDSCTKGGSINPMIQRYVMAVFYYATDGDNWDQCSAASDFSDAEAVAEADAACDRVVTPFPLSNRVGDTSTDAWLGPVNECEWGGIACWGANRPNLNLCIDQLDFGK